MLRERIKTASQRAFLMRGCQQERRLMRKTAIRRFRFEHGRASRVGLDFDPAISKRRQKVTALSQRLRMRTNPSNQSEWRRFERDQTMLHPVHLFADQM